MNVRRKSDKVLAVLHLVIKMRSLTSSACTGGKLEGNSLKEGLFLLTCFSALSLDANNDKDNSNDGPMKLRRQGTPESPSLQQFPLGSKRKEIKSVKGVLNSGMNAPLNSAGSKSRQSSRPGSPSPEQRPLFQQQHQQFQQQLQHQKQQLQQALQHEQQYQQQQQQQRPSAFGAGESPLMNDPMSAAARAAKVKSDLLMGLNSLTVRPGTNPAKDSSSASGVSDGGSPNQMNQMKLNMLNQGSYGSAPYESLRMNGYNSSGTVSGPPPGLGPSNGSISGNGGSSNSSPHLMSTMLNRENGSGPQGLPSYGNSGKPLDVATMMSTLDLFGPGSPASLMMSPNWSSMTNGSQQQHRQEMMNGQGGRPTNEEMNGGSATGSSTPTLASASATAHSVEDLELQVINAKMETQMLENQLNAVIKRNRRKLYA